MIRKPWFVTVVIVVTVLILSFILARAARAQTGVAAGQWNYLYMAKMDGEPYWNNYPFHVEKAVGTRMGGTKWEIRDSSIWNAEQASIGPLAPDQAEVYARIWVPTTVASEGDAWRITKKFGNGKWYRVIVYIR